MLFGASSTTVESHIPPIPISIVPFVIPLATPPALSALSQSKLSFGVVKAYGPPSINHTSPFVCSPAELKTPYLSSWVQYPVPLGFMAPAEFIYSPPLSAIFTPGQLELVFAWL